MNAVPPNLHPEPPCCLFVCTGNYYRSRFAEVVFNHLALQQGIAWRAFSRGLAIHQVGPTDTELSPVTREALAARGISEQLTGHARVQLGAIDLHHADHIVVLDECEHRTMMEEQFPDWVDSVEYWTVADLHAATAQEALPMIERCVQTLLAALLGREARG